MKLQLLTQFALAGLATLAVAILIAVAIFGEEKHSVGQVIFDLFIFGFCVWFAKTAYKELKK